MYFLPKSVSLIINATLLIRSFFREMISTVYIILPTIKLIVFMNFANVHKNRYILQQLMTKNGIDNFRQLSLKADVPELQLFRLQYGLIGKMSLETLVKIASALNLSLEQLISSFYDNSQLGKVISPPDSDTLAKEYHALQQQYLAQKQELTQEFQLASLDVLESWLLQWPCAVNAVKNNPDLPAVRLLPLVKPIFQLLESWGVEMIANVGEKIPYNPQVHDLIEGSAQPGDLVEVTYPGYRQGDKLLYRAKCRSVS